VQNDPTARDLFNAAYKTSVALGRKFEVTDLTPALRQAARAYAASYAGDFEFMVEMRARVIGGVGAFLTDGQSKSVLNCLAADARRRLAARAPKPAADAPAVTVPLGTFTVVALDGTRTTIRLQEPKAKDGRVFASFLRGADNDADYQYFATLRGGVMGGIEGSFAVQRQAVRAILAPTADLRAMGLAYSLESSNCWRCGRTLTVPASIHSGLGPDCADKLGAAYGEPQVTEVVPSPEPTPAAHKETTPAAVAAPSVRRSSNGARATRFEIDQTDGNPRPAAGYSYDEIFGTPEENADVDPSAVR
jgi:hypothetical protein